MLKRAAVTVLLSFAFLPINAFCADADALTNLDLQRNELLRNLTDGLVNGKITINDAHQLKGELDNVVKLETQLKEDPLLTPEHIQNITDSLKQVQTHIAAATHKDKVWLGINPDDKTIEQKISNALAAHKISKEDAEGFKVQSDELRARESNGDPTRGMEFDDALALATDIETLNNKIDGAITNTYPKK